MARHYGIITDLTDAPKEIAHIDVSTEASFGVRFGVFVGGVPTRSDGSGGYSTPIGTNANLFASSLTSDIPNLFKPSNGAAALVVAETVDASAVFSNVSSVAILRQRSAGTKNIVTLPREEVAAGTSFSIPLGDINQGATAFVASLDGGVTVNYQIGSGPIGKLALGPLAAGKIPLTIANSKVTIWTGSSFGDSATVGARIVVLLGIDTGKIDETFVLPFSP